MVYLGSHRLSGGCSHFCGSPVSGGPLSGQKSSQLYGATADGIRVRTGDLGGGGIKENCSWIKPYSSGYYKRQLQILLECT